MDAENQLAAELARKQVDRVRSATGDSLELALAIHSYLAIAHNLEHVETPDNVCHLSVECVQLFERFSPQSINVLAARLTASRCIFAFYSEAEDLEIAQTFLLPLYGDIANTAPQSQDDADRLGLLSANCSLDYALMYIAMQKPDGAVDWLRTSERDARAAFQCFPELLTQHLEHCLNLYRELKSKKDVKRLEAEIWSPLGEQSPRKAVQLLQTSEEGDSDSQVTALALDQRVLLQLWIKVGREGEYFDALYATVLNISTCMVWHSQSDQWNSNATMAGQQRAK
jgi:hypothetical protein